MPQPNAYSEEIAAAEEQGRAAYEAMEAWLSRPLDASDVPGSVLEGYARALRESRERLQRLHREHGVRDDIAAALERNREYHRGAGLSIRDDPDPADDATTP